MRLYDALVNSMGHCTFIDVTMPQLTFLLTTLSFVSLIVTHFPASFAAEMIRLHDEFGSLAPPVINVVSFALMKSLCERSKVSRCFRNYLVPSPADLLFHLLFTSLYLCI